MTDGGSGRSNFAATVLSWQRMPRGFLSVFALRSWATLLQSRLP
jgi:hypothetical protein